MNYKEAVETAVFQRVDDGRLTIGTTPLILANLADKLFPDNLSVKAGSFVFHDSRLDGMADLAAYMGLPGIRFVEPLYSVTAGVVPTKEFPKSLSDAFTVKALVPKYLDADRAEFFSAASALWAKVKSTGFYTGEQLARIQLCLDNGIVPVPVVADVYARYYGSLPLKFRAPPIDGEARAQKWTDICSAFKAATTAMIKKEYKQAAVLARQSAENVAMWDAIYAGVEAVRDAPFTAANALGSAFWNGIGFKWKLVIVGGALLGGAYFALPLLRMAKK